MPLSEIEQEAIQRIEQDLERVSERIRQGLHKARVQEKYLQYLEEAFETLMQEEKDAFLLVKDANEDRYVTTFQLARDAIQKIKQYIRGQR